MEKLIIDTFGSYAILVIPVISGIICSFIIEAANRLTPDGVSGKLITGIVCVLGGVGLIFVFPSVLTSLPDQVFFVALNISFAFIFYHAGGKKFIDLVMAKLLTKAEKKIDL